MDAFAHSGQDRSNHTQCQGRDINYLGKCAMTLLKVGHQRTSVYLSTLHLTDGRPSQWYDAEAERKYGYA